MPPDSKSNNCLVYRGISHFRKHVLLSTLSGKCLRLSEVRSRTFEPGLQEFEVNLLRLMDKITNGTIIELNETGTSLYYQPGALIGGVVEHDCSVARGIGYYLEVLLCLGVFCKLPLTATLNGVTANNIDPSVDHVKVSGLSTLRKFMLDDEGLEIKILKRGLLPLGGGKVVFKCPVKHGLRPIQFIDCGLVKRVRGVVFVCRMSPSVAMRVVEAAKGVFLNFITDIFIHVDHRHGSDAGKSPGFGIHLCAETTTGIYYSADGVSEPESSNRPTDPEKLGEIVAHRLLQEIYFGGCTDAVYQSTAALFMALGPKDVSKLVSTYLSTYTIGFLQCLKDFFDIQFKIDKYVCTDDEDEEPNNKNVLLTCVGLGYTNLNKKHL